MGVLGLANITVQSVACSSKTVRTWYPLLKRQALPLLVNNRVNSVQMRDTLAETEKALLIFL